MVFLLDAGWGAKLCVIILRRRIFSNHFNKELDFFRNYLAKSPKTSACNGTLDMSSRSE